MKKILFITSLILSLSASGLAERPVVRVDADDTGLFVRMDGEVICELKAYRYLRFRSHINNDHWIGQKYMPADIGWGYNDIKGYEHVSFTQTIEPGWFEINLVGRKGIADGDQETLIQGRWNPQTQHFDYTLSSNIKADLEKWYQNSKWAKSSHASRPKAHVLLEPMDYHVERISMADRAYADNRNDELYNCFVFSDDGKDWTRFPKVQAFYRMYKADWKYRFNRPEGSYFGFIDRDEGGWLTQLKRSSGNSRIEICWFWLDIHLLINDGVPPRHSSDRFEAYNVWEFTKVTPQQARDIMADSEEFPWRDMQEYQRPVYSQDNRFRDLIDGEQSQWNWRSTGTDCIWDNTVGYDDNQSVSIVKETDHRNVDAWYAEFQWYGYLTGFPFDWQRVEPDQTYCVRAMVKTEGVDGEVRLAVVNPFNSPVLYPDPAVFPGGSAPTKMETQRSESLTGTHDWTPLSVCFKPTKKWNYISLEIEGQGKVWFDNVVITKLDDHEPQKAEGTPPPILP